MLRKGVAAGSGRRRAAGWCPIFVRRCTIGVNAKLSQCERSFNLHPSSDAPRNEFAGGERGDNRGTKCPDPKALLDGIQQRFFICVHGLPPMVHRPARSSCRAPAFAPPRFRASRRPSVFPVPVIRLQTARHCARASGLPGWRARNASVTLSFRRPSGRENGRQFSYKQNAEEGVRLDEQRRTLVRGRKGGWRRSFVARCGTGLRGFPEPFCGLYARCDAIARRCARIRIRILMTRRFSDVSPFAGPAPSGRIGMPSRHRCARIDLPHDPAFLRLLHPDDTAVAHRDGRTTVSAGMRRMGAAFHGKTSMGAAGRDN